MVVRNQEKFTFPGPAVCSASSRLKGWGRGSSSPCCSHCRKKFRSPRRQSDLPGVATLNDDEETSVPTTDESVTGEASSIEPLTEILDGDVQPKILRRPLQPQDTEPLPDQLDLDQWVEPNFDAPLGYTGMSGIEPLESQTSGHFVPVGSVAFRLP